MLPVFVDSPMAIEALARYTAARAGARSRHAARGARREGAARAGRPRRTRGRCGASTRERERQVCAFCTERFRTISTAVESQAADAVEDAGDRHLGERHGDRRARAAPPDGRRCPTRATPCCSSAFRRPARAAGSLRRRREDDQDPRQWMCRCTRTSSRSTRCRRMPTRRRSCAGSAASSAPPALTFLVHGEPDAMEALQRDDQGHARLDDEDARASARRSSCR